MGVTGPAYSEGYGDGWEAGYAAAKELFAEDLAQYADVAQYADAVEKLLIVARHRHEWPLLWAAIDRLLKGVRAM